MRKSFAASLLTGAIVLALFGQSDASTNGKTAGFVYTNNKSVDYAFVTVYGVEQTVVAKIAAVELTVINAIGTGLAISGPLPTDHVLGSWCVHPGVFDKHGLTAVVHSVRIEMRAASCTNTTIRGENLVYTFAGIDVNGEPTYNAKPGVATITGGGLKIIGVVQNLPGGGSDGPSNEPGGPASEAVANPIVITETRGAGQ